MAGPGGRQPVVVVDGPAGSGKSTVCRLFAEKTGYACLDTGALYRAVAWQAARSGLSLDDEEGLALVCRDIGVVMPDGGGTMVLMVGEEPVDSMIRTEEVAMAASRISRLPRVREALLPLQREAGRNGGVIAEGRDMGTVVFPDAEIKIFLEAAPRERARRRWLELCERGHDPDYDRIHDDILVRDEQDRNRDLAPLRPSDDALVLDTTGMSIDDVIEAVVEIFKIRSVSKGTPGGR
ncbi:MAG: (d)CMP kinase [Syntrophales bacterium]|nr:(d)CMP kinase [Syntrophales bacterium]MCK9528326.1 (d)CMP kinase [Syntrophales bacterium]MDX9922165.1 (d)CMP kinase [Syntrophales bacterium]